MVNRVNIDRPLLDAGPDLKFVSTFSTGYNMVDLAAAKDHGVTVSNVPSYSISSKVMFSSFLSFGTLRGSAVSTPSPSL